MLSRRSGAGTLAVELVNGAVKGSVYTGFVAREGLERILAVALLAEGEREVIGGVGVVDAVFLEAGFHVGGLLLQDKALEDERAAESPRGGDDPVDQDRFVGIGGGKTVAKRIGVGVELVLAFRRGQDLGRSKAVFQCVETRSGFSFRGFGPGAALGVAAIGFDLFFGGHVLSAW